jgi:hypothetical protein
LVLGDAMVLDEAREQRRRKRKCTGVGITIFETADQIACESVIQAAANGPPCPSRVVVSKCPDRWSRLKNIVFIDASPGCATRSVEEDPIVGVSNPRASGRFKFTFDW